MLRITFLGIALLAITGSCKKGDRSVICTGDCKTLTGTLTVQGATTYQYGSHLLTTKDNDVYVLTSNVCPLNNFKNRKVILVGKHTDAPEQGPELYNVVY